ncbi:MAG: hypothetical protein K0R24_819 [Gammaproteobacteria bacterium]|nr:hypothetical protein [Gammaproteobacteria bacterium]
MITKGASPLETPRSIFLFYIFPEKCVEMIDIYKRKADLTYKRRGNVVKLLVKEIKSIKIKNFVKQHIINLNNQAN